MTCVRAVGLGMRGRGFGLVARDGIVTTISRTARGEKGGNEDSLDDKSILDPSRFEEGL